jgi:hypothetical protein
MLSNSLVPHASIPANIVAGLNAIDNSDEMQQAIVNNMFYVEMVETLFGGPNIGMIDDMPALYATQEQAEEDIAGMQRSYQKDIDAGERDEDDEWEGVLAKLSFSTTDIGTVCIYDEHDNLIATNSTVAQITGQ